MRTAAVAVVAVVLFVFSAGNARAWSLRDEVTVTGSGLTAELVWEIINAKTYCQASPVNLDRLSCALVADPGEFWVGLDAAGNGYGTINGADAAGQYFDLYRRPAGTKQSQAIARITKRKEPVFGQVTKLQPTSDWRIDPTSGDLFIGLFGSCLSAACTAAGDTTDHLGVIRISGLPTLFDLALSYQSPSTLSLKLPARPEGLLTADHIDLYYGPVGALANLATAQSLACNVAPSPAPGSVVTVPDALG
ncbi:MAG TPA: hypothetical protein VFQ07_17135, partial [Candidatus Polarisedimenticolia bacterium]|nr:hypothetical protein [Candidatus Polarisedimenticolia bacterium]